MKHCQLLYLPNFPWSHLVNKIYQQDSDLINLNYEEQKNYFLAKRIGYSDSISHWLRIQGFESTEVCWDVEPLQRQWAKENGVTFDRDWKTNILMEQIKKIQPRILYLQDIYALPLEVLSSIKNRLPFIEKIIIFRGFPGYTQDLFKYLSIADLVLVGSPHLVQQCYDQGIDTHLLYHSFDERNLMDEERDLKVSFIGSSGVGYGLEHYPRYYLLNELLERNRISAWVDEPPQMSPTFKSIARETLVSMFQLAPITTNIKRLSQLQQEAKRRTVMQKLYGRKYPLPPKSLFKRYPNQVHSGLFGVEMYRTLGRSLITLNCHTFAAKGFVDNIRMFQATGMGSCLLTDSGANMRDLFEPDSEVVTFDSVEDCIEKIEFLEKNSKKCQEIALAGQRRALKDHTTQKRAEQILDLIS